MRIRLEAETQCSGSDRPGFDCPGSRDIGDTEGSSGYRSDGEVAAGNLRALAGVQPLGGATTAQPQAPEPRSSTSLHPAGTTEITRGRTHDNGRTEELRCYSGSRSIRVFSLTMLSPGWGRQEVLGSQSIPSLEPIEKLGVCVDFDPNTRRSPSKAQIERSTA